MSAAKVSQLRPVSKVAVDDPYLSPEQVCELVPGMSLANLKRLRAEGKGPAYRKPTGDRGGLTLYRRSDVIAWIEASRVSTREQP